MGEEVAGGIFQRFPAVCLAAEQNGLKPDCLSNFSLFFKQRRWIDFVEVQVGCAQRKREYLV